MMIDLEKEIDKGLSLFPSTRYQGSKRRLLPWLYRIFKDIEFESVLDGFGGSASTSYLFKLMGKKVYFNDILKSNYQTGLALIENDSVKLNDDDIVFLLNQGDTKYPSFIADTFKDIYYHPEENKWLDMIVFNIKRLSSIYEGDILRKKQALAFHSLFQACLSKRPFNLFHRKNLYLRDSDVPRTFGNKKTWDLEFSLLFNRYAMESSSKVFSTKHKNKAFCKDIMSLRKQRYDFVYLDPPYQRPTDSHAKNYFSLYHFLEGLADYDNWSSRINQTILHKPLKQGVSKFDDLSSLERIKLIVEKYGDCNIAISYGDPGIPTVDELKELLSSNNRKVVVHNTEYSYKLNKKNGSQMHEVLIVSTIG
jgi:adenine-specific DNA methylase